MSSETKSQSHCTCPAWQDQLPLYARSGRVAADRFIPWNFCPWCGRDPRASSSSSAGAEGEGLDIAAIDDRALDTLRKIAHGPKGDRADYGGMIRGSDATAILALVSELRMRGAAILEQMIRRKSPTAVANSPGRSLDQPSGGTLGEEWRRVGEQISTLEDDLAAGEIDDARNTLTHLKYAYQYAARAASSTEPIPAGHPGEQSACANCGHPRGEHAAETGCFEASPVDRFAFCACPEFRASSSGADAEAPDDDEVRVTFGPADGREPTAFVAHSCGCFSWWALCSDHGESGGPYELAAQAGEGTSCEACGVIGQHTAKQCENRVRAKAEAEAKAEAKKAKRAQRCASPFTENETNDQ